MPDIFTTPDDFGPIKASDIYWMNKARVITDAHTFIVPLIWLAVAIVVFLTVRAVLSGGGWRLFRIAGLWLEAKERELSKRAGRPE